MQIQSHEISERELNLRFSFERDEVSLEYSLIGVIVHLPDCPSVGEPGSPALPSFTTRVALPPHTRLTRLQAEARETVKITDEVIPVAPLQMLRPGIIDDKNHDDVPVYRRVGEEERANRRKLNDPRQQERPFVEPFPTPRFTPPSPDLYTETLNRPRVQIRQTLEEGLTPVVNIQLNPVRLTTEGLLEFDLQTDVSVSYELVQDNGKERKVPAEISSRAQAMRQIALTRRTVINPEQVFDYSDLFPFFNLNTDYLIITDNQLWNAMTMTSTGPAGGDLVSSFGRLAAWKQQRGLSARVVTISEIMADRYGNFRTGSRDLQEVIRLFLQMVQREWGVAWVLFGGDTDIIPIRRAATDAMGGVTRQAVNPPPENAAFWTGTYLRIHATNLGVWWGAATDNLLVRRDNGLLIPYDGAGASSTTTRGWYFTTDNSYNTRSVTPTNFVRVNGPASEVDADLQFLYEWNTIPTDLYYSSLVGSQYNQPARHDWDLNDNLVYGQHINLNLDGINFVPTISLGRASVRTAAQADAFVNKVIAYEKFQRPDGTQLEGDWPRRVVLVSENWGGRLGIGSSGNNPPEDNTYNHLTGAVWSLIKLKDTPDWNWSLLAYISESDVRLLPYGTDAATTGRGWYFARSNTDLTPSIQQISFGLGILFSVPFPTQWIAVYGIAEELSPMGYLFNNIELDGSLADQEQLRSQWASELPGFTVRDRLYEDIQDMTTSQIAAAPVELITADRLRTALNNGPHIVSLSGHGSSYGCCKLSRDLADGLTNSYHTFIVYADSCLTNQLDGDAMSEHLVSNSNGGAIAYVGNTRFSWIGIGDDYQRRFFRQWSTLGGDAHLGLLCDTRATLFGSDEWWKRWAIMSLNLTGDPELPLWWREPLKFRIPEVYLLDKLRLIIDPPNPPDPPIDLPYRKNWDMTYVHLRQGEHQQIVIANSDGVAEISLTDFVAGPATLTVTRAGHQPLVQKVELSKSKKAVGCNPISWIMRIIDRLKIS